MKKSMTLFAVFLLFGLNRSYSQSANAKDILNKSLKAMGGKKKIAGLKNVVFNGTEYTNYKNTGQKTKT